MSDSDTVAMIAASARGQGQTVSPEEQEAALRRVLDLTDEDPIYPYPPTDFVHPVVLGLVLLAILAGGLALVYGVAALVGAW